MKHALILLMLLAAPARAATDVCFVPAEHCADRIVELIDQAQAQIRVQAYGFSARPILAALARAHARGVDVAVILDRSNTRGRAIGLHAMRDAGIPVSIDRPAGIAHIKAIVIDGRIVIGGSYNYTASAERRNVEDVTIADDPALARRFLSAWAERHVLAGQP